MIAAAGYCHTDCLGKCNLCKVKGGGREEQRLLSLDRSLEQLYHMSLDVFCDAFS